MDEYVYLITTMAVNCVSAQQAGEERSKPVRSDKYGGHTP